VVMEKIVRSVSLTDEPLDVKPAKSWRPTSDWASFSSFDASTDRGARQAYRAEKGSDSSFVLKT